MSRPAPNNMATGRPRFAGRPPARTPATTAPDTKKPKNEGAYSKDCAVLAGLSGPVIAAGSTMGASTRIRSRIVTITSPPVNPWTGFSLLFPLGQDQKDNEDAGFGVRYSSERARQDQSIQSDWHKVAVRFPRGKIAATMHDASPAIAALFPGATKLSLLSVRLLDGARVMVEGFGLPFANAGDPDVEGWVNHNMPIVGGITLLDLLERAEFHLVVPERRIDLEKRWSEDHLPAPFSYPYGIAQGWEFGLYEQLIRANQSKEGFRMAYCFDDDNSHLTVRCQAVVQDVVWLQQAVMAMSSMLFPAYFVDRGAGGRDYYCIIPLTTEFRDRFAAAWSSLAKDNEVALMVETGDNKEPAKWDGIIVGTPEAYAELQQHPTEQHELVVIVSRPAVGQRGHGLKNCVALLFDAGIPEAMRKVDAIGAFHPSSAPTNKGAAAEYKGDLEIADRMDLHRTLMRGNGFYEWMTRGSSQEVVGAMANLTLDQPRVIRPLPVVNLMDIPDDRYVAALLEEALPHDREPFGQYLRSRHLGLGIITAAPGFGKTTLLAVAGLAMHASLGRILVSAPSNVAVDNIAKRIHKVGASVARRYNTGKAEDDPNRARRPLVMRVYHPRQERAALLQLLQHPDEPVTFKSGKSPWHLELSVAYWFLVLLGSRAGGVEELGADDSESLHELRRSLEADAKLDDLRAVASGKLAWADFMKDGPPDLGPFMKQIVLRADMLCITPARSAEAGNPCLEFKRRLARGVLIDEAANMNMADYYCVAGNIMLPCVLGGDPMQLKPVVSSADETDEDGNRRNRFADDGAVSPLAFLQGSGIPVYRLTMQLRMAEGLFDWVGASLYPEVHFRYGRECNIFRPHFAAGRALEARARARFPDITPAPLTKLLPLFLHCPGSVVYVDKATHSRLCPVQVTATLDFALDLVQNAGIKAADIAILCPYSVNVKLMETIRKRPVYGDLIGMDPASTVDSYQGRESDIVLVTMGTTFPYPGPGFTKDENRLCVLLTRQKAGLVIVGDVNIDKGLRPGEKLKPGKVRVVDEDGSVRNVGARLLHTIYTQVAKENRVMRLRQAPAGDGRVEGPAA